MGLPAAARRRWPMPSPTSAMCHSCASPPQRLLLESQVLGCRSAEYLQYTPPVCQMLGGSWCQAVSPIALWLWDKLASLYSVSYGGHGLAGESEAKVRQLFQEAADVAPCIVFIGTLLLAHPVLHECALTLNVCELSSRASHLVSCTAIVHDHCDTGVQMRLTPSLQSARARSARWSAVLLRRC